MLSKKALQIIAPALHECFPDRCTQSVNMNASGGAKEISVRVASINSHQFDMINRINYTLQAEMEIAAMHIDYNTAGIRLWFFDPAEEATNRALKTL